MISTKQNFIHAIKKDQNLMTYVITTGALLLTLSVQETIRGNFNPTHFGYSLLVSFLFITWAVLDYKCRKSAK